MILYFGFRRRGNDRDVQVFDLGHNHNADTLFGLRLSRGLPGTPVRFGGGFLVGLR